MESQRAVEDTPARRISGFHIPSGPSTEVQKWVPKSSLRDRPKLSQDSEAHASVSPALNSPWRPILVPPTPTDMNVLENRSPIKAAENAPSGLSTAMKTRGTLAAAEDAGRPGMGPVISPARQASYGNISVTTKRRGDAWAASGTNTGSSSASRLGSRSFEAPRSKKSLKQIQEEEQARQAEAEFARWWAEEEERVRAEEEQDMLAAIAASMHDAKPGGGSESPKGKPRSKAKPRRSQGRKYETANDS